MQVKELKTEGLKREYEIVVPSKDIERKLTARIEEVGRTVKVDGFRPGKAPKDLLRQRYAASLYGEVCDKAINDGMEELLKDKNLRPALQPNVELKNFKEGEDLVFAVNLEVVPEINPVDFTTLKLERLKAEVSEEEVQKTLERIAEGRKDTETVSEARKAKKGDITLINFVGSIDGVEFQGGAGNDYPLELGSNSFIPGFEEQLVGASAGDKVDVKVSFPKEYHAKDLAGKDAVFAVEVKELRKYKKVEINDEFAKSMGEENLDKFKEAVKEHISKEYDAAARQKLKRSLLDVLADNHSFEVPTGLVEAEFKQILTQYEQAKKMGNLDEDDASKSEDAVKGEYKDIAERRVRLGLLLAEVSEKNSIKVAQDDLNKAIFAEARRFPGQEKAVFEYYSKNRNAVEALKAPILEEKIVDFILDKVEITDKVVPVDELYADPDAATAKKTSAKKSTAKKASSKKATAEGEE